MSRVRSRSTSSTSARRSRRTRSASRSHCSSGTYVRSLAADLGTRAGRRRPPGNLATHRRRVVHARRGRAARSRSAPRSRAPACPRWCARSGIASSTTSRQRSCATAAAWARDELGVRRLGDGPVGGARRGRRRCSRSTRITGRHGEARRRASPPPTWTQAHGPGQPVASRGDGDRPPARSVPAGRRRLRGHDRRLRRRAPRPPGGDRGRCASWPPQRGLRDRGRHLRPPPGRGRAARVGAAAAHRPRPEARAARGDRRRSTRVVLHFDEARAAEPAEDFVARGARRRASARGSSSSAPTSTSATGARATSRCCSSMGAELGFDVARPRAWSTRRRAGRRRRAGTRPPRIRELLAAGDVGRPRPLLGPPARGARHRSSRGDQRGRDARLPHRQRRGARRDPAARRRHLRRAGSSGPTASVHPAAHLARSPADLLRAGRTPRCSRPTCSTSTATSTDEHVKVRFVDRLRGEEQFDSVEALVEQMHADVEATRRALG